MSEIENIIPNGQNMIKGLQQLLDKTLTPEILAAMTDEQRAEINKALNTKLDGL